METRLNNATKNWRLAAALFRIAAFSLAAFLASCGGSSTPVQSVAPVESSVNARDLPPIPRPGRTASQTALVMDGSDSFQASESAQHSGNRLILQALPGAGGLGWAIYQFTTLESAKFAVELRCLPGDDGDEYWLGLADYSLGSWRFSGPFSGIGTLPALPGGDYLSEGGYAYAVVIAYDTARVVVDQLELKLSSNPPPPAPAGLSAVVLPGSIALNWEALDTPGLLGYNVYFATQNFSLPEQSTVSRYNDLLVPATASPGLELTELSADQLYFFRVAAVVADQVESALSNSVSASTNYLLSINSVMPTRQYPGFWCYLSGSGYNPVQDGTQVLWNGTALPASDVRDVSTQGLRFRLPANAPVDSAGEVRVKVGAAVSDLIEVVAVDPQSRPRAWAHIGKTLYQSYEMYEPEGVAVDTAGNIYVAQNTAGRIDVYKPDGSFKTSYVISDPADIEISPGGRILVKQGGGPELWWIDKDSGAVSAALDSEMVDADWGGGEFCAFAANGSGSADDAYYLSDREAACIRKYVGGVLLLKIGEGILERPQDVELDGSGNLVIADEWTDSVYWFSSGGTLLGQYDGSADLDPNDGELRGPLGLCLAPDGHVYVADRERDRLLKLNAASRSFVSECGASGYQDGDGSNLPDPLGQEARFWGLWGVAGTGAGIVFTDDYNQRCGLIEPDSGNLLLGLADYCAPAGEFVDPSSIGVRSSDGAYAVLDGASYTITLLDRNNQLLDLAYLETSGDESDIATGRMGRTGMVLSWRGGKAAAAGKLYFTHSYEALTEFTDDFGNYKLLNGDWGSQPGQFKGAYGLAVDNDELYAADEGNDRVQVFGLDGLYQRSINMPDSANFSANKIALDTEHNYLYVLDRPWSDQSGVARFNAGTGAYIDRLSVGSGVGSVLALDPAGNIYLYQYYEGYLFAKYAPPATPGGQYTLLTRFGSSGDGDGELRDIQCLSITPDGRFLIGDSRRRQIVILVP